MSWRRAVIAVPLVAVLGVALAGCVQGNSSTAPRAVPTPIPSSTSTAVPVLDTTGNAQQNLAYFDLVGHTLLDNNPKANANGRTIVDYFVAHGFDKSQMQVTPDKTSIGLAVWNIEFSVKMKNSCLIGQAGNTGFQSFATTVLATGKCLIGQTRTINW